MTHASPRTLAAICIFGLSACPGPKGPSIPPAAAVTTEVGDKGWSLLGAAASDSTTFAALSSDASHARVVARRGSVVAWTRELEGRGGPLALGPNGGDLYVALAGTGSVAGGAVRGEPGAAIVALDPATGAVKWRVALDAAGWATIGATAALPDGGVLVGGTYTTGLRAGAHVVGAGGRTDGFVLLVRATGEVAWLVRLGGVFADGVQGVAARKTERGLRLAIAGTFQATADLQGAPLPFFDERSPFPDAFVAELSPDGKRVWSQTFGGKLLESVAGVAIDAAGKVVVAASSTGELHVGGLDFIAQGSSDGVLSWWNADGSPHHAILVGGQDFDGFRAIVAAGASVVVGGFYSGSMSLGDRALAAGGGDDAFLAALDPNGRVTDAWTVSGPGREEIVSLAPIRGGFVAGIGYTAAASLAGADVAAPADPMSGAAVIVRGTR
ncbi:MAG: hypothetical protein AB7T06_43545 [Kofleriaceae bacterium]